MEKANDLNKRKEEYKKQNYDRTSIFVPAGKKDKIKAFAADNGESLSAYIVRLIREDMEKYK